MPCPLLLFPIHLVLSLPSSLVSCFPSSFIPVPSPSSCVCLSYHCPTIFLVYSFSSLLLSSILSSHILCLYHSKFPFSFYLHCNYLCSPFSCVLPSISLFCLPEISLTSFVLLSFHYWNCMLFLWFYTMDIEAFS